LISLAVAAPCSSTEVAEKRFEQECQDLAQTLHSLCPPSNSFSSSSNDFPVLANASATFRFLPPIQLVIKSATPADSSRKVADLTLSKNSRPKFFISTSPIRMMAAKVGGMGKCQPDGTLGCRSRKQDMKLTLGVITPLEPIDETGRYSNDICNHRRRVP
jgi:hypothetical protein